MKTLELNQMENVQGGKEDPVADAILGTCLVVGVAASVGAAFITFGTSLWWGSALTSAFCAGAAVGEAMYDANNP